MKKSKDIIPFNVIIERNGKFISMDIMQYLIDEWKKNNKNTKSINKEEISKFIEAKCKYRFWSRCQYEIILSDWPNKKIEEKIDVYQQIKMNFEVVVDVFMANLFY